MWLALKNRVVNGRVSPSSLWIDVYGQQPGLRPLLCRLSLLLTGYGGQMIQASCVFGNLFYKDFGSSTVCGDGPPVPSVLSEPLCRAESVGSVRVPVCDELWTLAATTALCPRCRHHLSLDPLRAFLLWETLPARHPGHVHTPSTRHSLPTLMILGAFCLVSLRLLPKFCLRPELSPGLLEGKRNEFSKCQSWY